MSFIETPATRHYPWYVRIPFPLQRRHYDRVLEPARLWGRTPRAFLAMALIACQNMSSKFNAALGVAAQGFWRVPVFEEQLWQPTPSAE